MNFAALHQARAFRADAFAVPNFDNTKFLNWEEIILYITQLDRFRFPLLEIYESRTAFHFVYLEGPLIIPKIEALKVWKHNRTRWLMIQLMFVSDGSLARILRSGWNRMLPTPGDGYVWCVWSTIKHYGSNDDYICSIHRTLDKAEAAAVLFRDDYPRDTFWVKEWPLEATEPAT